jgi:cytochrome c-type biogenesis protein CcmH/NrfG
LARVGGDREQALALARHALSEEPNTVRGWLMVSRLELERGRIDAAREAYETAARLAPLYQRPGLSKYEKDLLRAPDGEVKEIQRLLIAAEASPASEGQAAP